jgi:hypothetical protein
MVFLTLAAESMDRAPLGALAHGERICVCLDGAPHLPTRLARPSAASAEQGALNAWPAIDD